MVLQTKRRQPPLVRKETWMKVKDPAMIRRWRQQERFTQRDLAALVRRSQTTIYLLETGGMKTLTEDLAISIASRLHVPWEVLFELEEHEVMSIVTREPQVAGNEPKIVTNQHAARLTGSSTRKRTA